MSHISTTTFFPIKKLNKNKYYPKKKKNQQKSTIDAHAYCLYVSYAQRMYMRLTATVRRRSHHKKKIQNRRMCDFWAHTMRDAQLHAVRKRRENNGPQTDTIRKANARKIYTFMANQNQFSFLWLEIYFVLNWVRVYFFTLVRGNARTHCVASAPRDRHRRMDSGFRPQP